MFKKAVLAGIVGTMIAGTVEAQSSSKEEGLGLGAGAVVGAVVGGPVGAIIGAAIGAKAGDSVHERSERMESLADSLEGSETQIAHLEAEIDSLNGEIAGLDDEMIQLRNSSSRQLASLLQAGVAMDLLFRTDEDALSDKTSDRLHQLAGTLATMDNISIRLDGFADERGDAEYNQELSERRVIHVRDLLLATGIPESRIEIHGHGETPAIDENLDSLAFDRKVSVTLYIKEDESLAANP